MRGHAEYFRHAQKKDDTFIYAPLCAALCTRERVMRCRVFIDAMLLIFHAMPYSRMTRRHARLCAMMSTLTPPPAEEDDAPPPHKEMPAMRRASLKDASVLCRAVIKMLQKMPRAEA